MREGHHHIKYRPMPKKSRYGLLSWPLHNEISYTQDEMQFRAQVLIARSSSGIDAALLQTSNNWFADENELALININKDSWLLKDEYKPRFRLTQDDFHIKLINPRLLNWPGLSTMTRFIGDYLLLRNSRIGDDYLNQPMNYVLLDLVQILNRLAVIEDGEYVSQQLQFIRKYMRFLEIHLSPTSGSDRLFIADCRRSLEEKIQADIEHKLSSQQLKVRFEQVQQQLNRVAEMRHAVLHFALAGHAVNPHPYWEHFVEKEAALESNQDFPTLAAKACAVENVDDLTLYLADNEKERALPILLLSGESLDECENFKFIDKLGKDVKTAYGKGISDLQEVLRFRGIIDQLLQLFDKAGEVFTLIQFREQMHQLLTGIEQFIQNSEQTILDIQEANANAYHQYIQEKQDLKWWDKWLSARHERINAFIGNQDNLSRFATSPAELHLAGKELLEQINGIIAHLNQQSGIKRELAMISSTREVVQRLMTSIHAWVNHQHELNGLTEIMPSMIMQDKSLNSVKPASVDALSWHSDLPLSPGSVSRPSRLTSSPAFWPQASSFPAATASSCQDQCLASTMGSDDLNLSLQTSSIRTNNDLALGLLVLLPLAILILVVIYEVWNTPVPTPPNPNTFKKAAKKTADLLSLASHLALEFEDDYWQRRVENIANDYDELAHTGKSDSALDINKMKDLLDELAVLVSAMEEDVLVMNSPG